MCEYEREKSVCVCDRKIDRWVRDKEEVEEPRESHTVYRFILALLKHSSKTIHLFLCYFDGKVIIVICLV